MPRVNEQKAAKDYPEHGIKKGDTYYSWKFRYGGKRMSKARPRPSQLTQSKLSAAYAAQEELEDVVGDAADPQALIDALNGCAEAVREVAEEYRESVQNMPESLQQGQTAQDCEERADSLDSYADDCEAAASEIESMNVDEFIDKEALRERAKVELASEHDGEDYVASDDEIDAKVEEMEKDIDDFESLTADEQAAYMDQAREHAGEPSLEV